MSKNPDFLDEMIAERSATSEAFPRLLQDAVARRALLRSLANERVKQGISQTKIAAAMDTSQSFIARLESSATDTKLSTIERYAATLGLEVQFRLVKADQHDGSNAARR